jgi:hypothetical protein
MSVGAQKGIRRAITNKGRNYKLQNSNNKQITMTKLQNSKQV